MKQVLILLFFSICPFLSAVPLITNITPNTEADTGVVPVVISGSGFTGVTSVTVDGASVASFTVVNDSTIDISNINAIPHVPENVTVVVTTPAGSSPPNHPNDFYTFKGDWTLVIPVVNQNHVYTYSVNAHALNPSPIPVSGTSPVDVVIDPFGKYAYVVSNVPAGSDSLTVIDIASHSVAGTLNLTLQNPNVMAISPTQPKAYITDGATNASYAVVNLTTPASPTLTSVMTQLAAGDSSIGVAFQPDGLAAFIGGATLGKLYKINTSTDDVSSTTSLPSSGIPGWITMKPNQDFGILIDAHNTLFQTFDFIPLFLASTSTNSVLQTELDASRDNNFAYDLGNFHGAHTLQQLDVTVSSPTHGFTLPVVNTTPLGVWLTPDSKTAFVTDSVTTTVTRVDGLPSSHLATTFNLPSVNDTDSQWPCITPDQAPVARFTATIAPGNTALFDGSGSVSPVGTIASYIWNFGDGSPPVTTTAPTVSHTYASSGPFTVTLQVVNSAGTSIASSSTFTGQTFSNHGADFAATSLAISFVPGPPTNGTISQTVDKFLTQVCYENTITWSPPTSGSPPVSYIIFSDAALTQVLGTVPASGPLVFVVCSKTAHATYYIVAVDAAGIRSTPPRRQHLNELASNSISISRG